MKRLTEILFFFSYFFLTGSLAIALTKGKPPKECTELFADLGTSADSFLVYSGRKLFSYRHLPEATARNFRLASLESPSIEGFRKILEVYGITLEQWRSVEKVKFEERVILGTKQFLKAIDSAFEKQNISKEQRDVLLRINDAADDARERLKKSLFDLEEKQFSNKDGDHRLRSWAEINEAAQAIALDAEFRVSYLGFQDIAQWRKILITERPKLREKLRGALVDAIIDFADKKGEIPEAEDDLLEPLAKSIGIEKDELRPLLGEALGYLGIHEIITAAQQKRPATFAKVTDRRLFTKARENEMLEAVAHSANIIAAKLPENQSWEDFEEVEQLSRGLGEAPIVIAPAFGEVGLIPDRMADLFEKPNTFFLVDQGIKVTPDIYFVNHGSTDKQKNPFTGLHELYPPTASVLVFCPQAMSEMRYTGNYSFRPGQLFGSGAMSDPAYASKFLQGMFTDVKAEMLARENRSVSIVSRYENPRFSHLGGAQSVGFRRARYTEALYGNPAGLFDLGVIYSKDGMTRVPMIPAITLGDIHLGNTEPQYLKATLELFVGLGILQKNPNFGEPLEREYIPGPVKLGAIVLHDLIEGTPNNRHNFEKLLTQARLDAKGELELTEHVQKAASWMKLLGDLLPETRIVIPVDNHGSDWLIKRLEQADFTRGSGRDMPLLLKLMLSAIEHDTDPYLRVFQEFGIHPDQVQFMEKNQDYRIAIDLENPDPESSLQGVSIGKHSHQGRNGARSISLRDLLVGYGPIVTGHTHTGREYGQSVQVGTATPVANSFHRGPSNSSASIVLIYGKRAIQLLPLVQGSFLPTNRPQPREEFFPNDQYPRLLVRTAPPEGRTTTEQYRSNPPAPRYPRR